MPSSVRSLRSARAYKRADKIAAYLEATQLAGFSVTEARRYFGRFTRLPDIALRTLPPVVSTATIESATSSAPADLARSSNQAPSCWAENQPARRA